MRMAMNGFRTLLVLWVGLGVEAERRAMAEKIVASVGALGAR